MSEPEKLQSPAYLAVRAAATETAFKWIIEPLRTAARCHGYALAVHGSLSRDIDLVAVPWVESAGTQEDLVRSMLETVKAIFGVGYMLKEQKPEEKPHGRVAWTIHIGFPHSLYLDISIMPRVQTSTEEPKP